MSDKLATPLPDGIEVVIYAIENRIPYLFIYRDDNLIAKINCSTYIEETKDNFDEEPIFECDVRSLYKISNRYIIVKIAKRSDCKYLLLLDLKSIKSSNSVSEYKAEDILVTLEIPFKDYSITSSDNNRLLLEERIITQKGKKREINKIMHLMEIKNIDDKIPNITYQRLGEYEDLNLNTNNIYKCGFTECAFNLINGKEFNFDGFVNMILYDKYIIGNSRIGEWMKTKRPGKEPELYCNTEHCKVSIFDESNKETKIKADGLMCSDYTRDVVCISSIYASRKVYFISPDSIEMKRIKNKVDKFLSIDEYGTVFSKGYNMYFGDYEGENVHLLNFKTNGPDIIGVICSDLKHERICKDKIIDLELPSGIKNLIVSYM